MKRINLFSIVALTMSLLVAGCEPEPVNPTPTPTPTPEAVSLANTYWVGSYSGNFEGYYSTITYSLDFLDEHTGVIELESMYIGQNTASGEYSADFTYTFDGSGSGVIHQTANNKDIPFTYRASDKTITLEYTIGIQIGEGAIVGFGGEIEFHPRTK